jgi:hypothetical protein
MKKPPIGRLFRILVLATRTTIGEVAKLNFLKPSVERLSEQFLKKEGFSESTEPRSRSVWRPPGM